MPSSGPLRSLAIILALGIAVSALGSLQYRWIEQFTQAERQRLEAHLESSVEGFLREFNLEVMSLAAMFRLTRPEERGLGWAEHRRLYEEWRQFAQHPQLVTALYGARAGEATFERVDGEGSLPPAIGERVQSALAECFEAGPGQSRVRVRWPFFPMFVTIGDWDPLLILPEFNGEPEFIREIARPSPEPPAPRGFLVAQLNSSFLRDELFPLLWERSFGSSPKAEFRVAVLAGPDSERVVYVSEPGAEPSEFHSCDIRTEIFWSPARRLPPGARPYERRPRLRDRLPFVECRSEETWVLAVRHRTGSVAEAVAGAKWRNLAVSGGVLAILTLSVLMLLASTRRAERLARLQMEFAAGVSHELRTPLSVIRLVADNLARRITASGEQVSEAGALILRESRRLSSLVEHSLQFTAMRARRKPPELQPVQAEEIVRLAIDEAQPLIDEAGFRVETHFCFPLPAVAADPDALGRCVQNLLDNALKYSGERRNVQVRVESHNGRRDTSVRISVVDGGPGISRDEVPHIFDPFFQGARNGEVKSRGVGLGLTLTKEMMEAMGGKVSVETGPGGSRFTLHVKRSHGVGNGETNSYRRG